MDIPNFQDAKMVETEGENAGMLTETWRMILSQLFAELQQKASNEGLVAPPQPTVNINLLGGDNQRYVGGLIYDLTTNQLKVGILNPGDGTVTFKAIQTI